MEQQMATLNGLKTLRSVSAENYSAIILEFENDTNLDTISVDIRDKIDLVAGAWSDRISKPIVLKLNPDMMPITVAAVSKDDTDNSGVSDLLNRQLLRLLEGTDGVASVSTAGLVENSIHVALNQEKIDSANEAMQQAVIEQFGGAYDLVSEGLKQAESQAGTLDDAKKQIVTAQEGLATQFDALRLMLLQKSAELAGLIAQNPDQAETLVPQLTAVTLALLDLDDQKDVAYSKLANSMSEVVAARAMLQMTVAQLESSLAELESSRDAAVDAANLTGFLTMSNVSAIIAAQNLDMPAGYVTDGSRELMVSVGDRIKNVQELKDLVVMDASMPGMDPIRLSDVADVTEFSSAGETYAKINGQDGVMLTFQKQSDYPTTEVAGNIQDKFAQLEETYPGLHFVTLSDQGEYIYMVINSVLENLLMGAVLAILILLFFLRDIRPTLITALSIPISLTFAVVLMYFTGVTLNVISLAGLAVGVGMLVDNSIIVIENIFRLRNLGLSKIQAALTGVSQMAGAITSSTLTTICVFFPLVFVEGITKQIFTDMALTVTYSLLASLIIALTLVPAMGSTMLNKTGESSVLKRSSRTMEWYCRTVEKGLRHKAVVLVAAVLLFALSAGLSVVKGFEYMPTMASPEISATITLPDDNTLEETAATSDKIAAELATLKGVRTVSTMLASDQAVLMGFGGQAKDYSEVSLYVLLEEDQLRQNQAVTEKIKALALDNGGEASVYGGADISGSSALGGGGVSIQVYADDLDQLRLAAADIEEKLSGIEGLEDVSDSSKGTLPEFRITVDKDAAMAKGLTVAQVYAQIAGMLADSQTATSMMFDDNQRDVVVTGNALEAKTIDALKDLTVLSQNLTTGKTTTVALRDIADFSEDKTLESITHVQQNRALEVSAAVKEGYNVTLVTGQARDALETLDLPKGTSYEFSGEEKAIMDAMTQLLQMLALGLLLIYLVMVAQFQSLMSPFIVMFTVPLAFTGGLLALLIAGKEISVVSMIGFILLNGVVVNNAIVLIDTMNRFRTEGMERREAIIEAGAARLRPVLMTAITTILGLLPLALGFGTGAELIQPVAIVCVGGLLYATLTTLLVIPVMYDIFARKNLTVISDEELTVADL
jgi:HAE1 family hydrophobic/amphiphilic exporter-1